MKNSDLEVLQTVVEWLEAGSSVELVTLVNCWGSAPRPVGSIAAVRGDGAIVGSVSGGCIEKELSTILRKNDKARVVRHSVSREQAVRFGLLCGGELELVFERIESAVDTHDIINSLSERQRVLREVDLETGKVSLSPADRNQEFSFDGNVLKKVFGPSWRLLLIGAGQLSRYVAEMGLALDYEVQVCEPRSHFAKVWDVPGTTIDTRLPDEVVQSLSSDPRSAVLALTHEPNLDDLALMQALNSDAFYIGALGSKKNNELRRRRLVETLGVNQSQLERLHGPIGLDIGSQTPAEIAISILAEVIAVRNNIYISGKVAIPGSSSN
jgi:xanthine dehydrogenase accessory factor